MDETGSRVEQPEKFSPHKFRNFFELSDQEKEVLRQRLNSNKGNAVVLIHPYFKGSDLGDDQERPVDEAYQQTTTYLENAAESGPPIFFFQGGGNIEVALKRADKYLERAKSTVYVVPTYPGSPEPITDSRHGTYFGTTEESGWDTVIADMKALGIKKIIIGGIYFNLSTDSEHIDDVGCVNHAISKLDKDFEIKLSTMTWPSNREAVKKLKKGRFEQYL